mgnify:CR=1 FL=1
MQNKIEIFDVFMNFAIINGSPKGNYSITLQSVLYLQKKFPEHQYNILNVGQSIKALEKDFSKAKEIVGRQFAEVVEDVSVKVTERLDSEYARLKHLMSMRGSSENTPALVTMKKNIQDRKKALSGALLRLDGIRLVVCR